MSKTAKERIDDFVTQSSVWSPNTDADKTAKDLLTAAAEAVVEFVRNRIEEEADDVKYELQTEIACCIDLWCYQVFMEGESTLHDPGYCLAGVDFESQEEMEAMETRLKEEGISLTSSLSPLFGSCPESDTTSAEEILNHLKPSVEELVINTAAHLHEQWVETNNELFYKEPEAQYRFVPFEMLGWKVAEPFVKLACQIIEALGLEPDKAISKKLYALAASRSLQECLEKQKGEQTEYEDLLSRCISDFSSYSIRALEDRRYIEFIICPQLAQHGGLTSREATELVASRNL